VIQRLLQWYRPRSEFGRKPTTLASPRNGDAVKTSLWVWLLANGVAGVAIVLLLLIDPPRDLRPVFVLLAVAVGTLFAWRFWPRRK
jgi:hypothetical protein